jgi:hypothetical protein
MSLKKRLREVERKFRPPASGPLAPHIWVVYVDSKAPCLNPGPIKWGTVPGVVEIFERGPDESESDFIDRLQEHLPADEPKTGYSVTIHAESMKPELPAS